MRNSKLTDLLNQSPRAERTTTTIKVSRELYEQARDLCIQRGISISDFFDAMLTDSLAAVKKTTGGITKRNAATR